MLRFLRSNNNAQLPDEELVEKFAEGGNTSVLGILYERYMPLIYGICLKYLKDPMAAEDAVMLIYEQVARKLAESEVQNFKAWVCTVARNHCLMQLRKDKNVHIEHVDPSETWHFDQPSWETADTAAEKEHQLQLLENCLQTLNEVQKQHVSLFYLQNMSYQEVSDQTQIPVGTVRSHIQNGRRNLKNCMEISRR
jgi:RNA polymerase sigma factor (sigma-70 family)